MAAAPRIGDVIAGKYCVERVLGRGGMGVVVAARHLHLRERVAIKFLVEGRGRGADVVARFVREGRAAMCIRSEHVVRVLDLGALETGEPFLVMEYLVGDDLAAVVARVGHLPIEAAVVYVLLAIVALAEAHASGIIHRDLKPSNLFLARRADGSPVVKVLDFGVAKTLGDGADASATASSALLGTPVYMAPEQMRSRGAVDARTDIWALGVTLHALLTGAPPFPAGSMLEIHESILRGAPPLRQARPDAPAALEAVVLRCLQKDPADRYATVADVAEALAEVDAGARPRLGAPRLLEDPEAAAPLVEDALEATDTAGEGSAPTRAPSGATRTEVEPSWNDAAPGSATTGSRTGASPPVVTAAPARGRPAWQRVLALAVAAAMVGGLAFTALGSRKVALSPDAAATHPGVTVASAPPLWLRPARCTERRGRAASLEGRGASCIVDRSSGAPGSAAPTPRRGHFEEHRPRHFGHGWGRAQRSAAASPPSL